MCYVLHCQIAQLQIQLKLSGHQASDNVVGPLCQLLIHEGDDNHIQHHLGDGSSCFENGPSTSSSHEAVHASYHYCITWSTHGPPDWSGTSPETP